MPGGKSGASSRKVMKTRKLSQPEAKKETAQRKASGRKVTSQKGKRTSVKTATAKKISAKTPKTKARSQGKVLRDKTATVKVKGAADTRPVSKKRPSGREKLIQGIRKKLVIQRNELLSEAEEALNMLPGQTIFPDMGDQASAEVDRSFMLRLRGREQRLLKKIEAAIDKIDSGSFGICEVCGEEIDVKRLDARPVTTMCIFCKTEQEEEEKLRGT